MNPKCLVGLGVNRDTYSGLRGELSEVDGQIKSIASMLLDKDTEKSVIDQLTARRNEIKERLHNFIDTL